MSAEFVDTNVLVYAHDISAGPKHDLAESLIERLFHAGTGALSVNVLGEFYAAATRKGKLPASAAEEIVADYVDWAIHCPNHADLIRSAQLHRRYQVPWWDAMHLNSAIQLGCTTLWTEDFSHGQQFGALTIRNPFRA